MSDEQTKQGQTFWVRLYAVKRGSSHYFVYGYAASAKGTPSDWKMSKLPVSGSTWKLNQFNCFADESEIQRLQRSAEDGKITIRLGAESLPLVSSRLAPRPNVIAIPHESHSIDRPKSFSEDMAEMESHWELNKPTLIERLFPASTFDADNARRMATDLLDQLETATGIKFSNEDAGRLGNFDVFRHLSGDIRLPDGLYCRSLRTELKENERHSLLVWLESPMADMPNLLVGCRLFNGGSAPSRTCIMNEVREYSRDEKIEFIPKEPFSQFEVSVWSSQKLVGYRTFSIVRGISFNMHASGATNRVRTKWSESFPTQLQARAENVQSGISQRFEIGSKNGDPWRDAELFARTAARTGYAKSIQAKFFGVGPEEQLKSLEFLSSLLLRESVRRVIIADPFFDDIGVESLLVKVPQTQEVLILASHTSLSGGKARLLASCKLLREYLPRNVTIINIESPGESTQQFHDRYLLIEMKNGSKVDSELWMMSNSFSSMAKNYPLIITMLPPDVAEAVATYIGELEQGKPPGKTHATRTIVWSKTASDPSPRPVAPSGKAFDGSDTILGLLLSAQGLISDWRVADAALPTVVGVVKRAFGNDPLRRAELILATARWHYHGGPSPLKYEFDQTELQWLSDALRHLLTNSGVETSKYSFDVLDQEREFSECLDEVWNFPDQMSFELRQATPPELGFLADALWTLSPEHLAEILGDTKSPYLLCWLCMEGSRASTSQIDHLLASQFGFVKALGVALLKNTLISPRRGGASVGDVNSLCAALAISKLAPFDRFMAILYTEARSSVVLTMREASAFAHSIAEWPQSADPATYLAKITAVLENATSNRGIAAASLVADQLPEGEWPHELRKWCLNEILFQFIPKEPNSVEGNLTPRTEAANILGAARCVWALHGADSYVWFKDAVLQKLKVKHAVEPLLRTRDYTKWTNKLHPIILAFWFGRAIQEQAPNAHYGVEFAKQTAPMMSLTLNLLGPEVWMHYLQRDKQLLYVTSFIGWSADFCDACGFATIEKLALSDQVPSVWQLWIFAHSPRLLLKYAAIVETLASRLSTWTHCYEDELEAWCDRIQESMEYLDSKLTKRRLRKPKIENAHCPRRHASEHEEARQVARLRGLFHVLRISLSRWRSSFASTQDV